MGQILRYCTELPEPPAGAGPEELERFIVTDFVATVRARSRSTALPRPRGSRPS
jgi:hypothetical protein